MKSQIGVIVVMNLENYCGIRREIIWFKDIRIRPTLTMLLLDQVRDAFCFLIPQTVALQSKAVVKCLQCLLAIAFCVVQQPAASITAVIYTHELDYYCNVHPQSSSAALLSVTFSMSTALLLYSSLPCILASKAH